MYSRDLVLSDSPLWVDSRAFNNVDEAITSIGSDNRTLYINRPENISKAIPSNISLSFGPEGRLVSNVGQVIASSPLITASEHQLIFDTDSLGSWSVQGVSTLHSSWFGSLENALIQSSGLKKEIQVGIDDTLANDLSAYDLSDLTVVIKPGVTVTHTVSQTINFCYDPQKGGLISVAAGVTLTIGSFNGVGKLWKVFEGDGDIKFGSGAVEAVHPEWWGAKGDWDGTTGTDDTLAIQKAIEDYDKILCSGSYTVAGMLELTSNKSMVLTGSLHRSASGNTTPLVWVNGSSASLDGGGRIDTQSAAPDGIVLIGHRDLTQSHANVVYCKLQNLTICGMSIYGQTTGSPDIAVNLVNPQFGGLVSYFHTVHNLTLVDANIGIALQGWANANSISNIELYRVGNTSISPYAGIWINGAQENRIYDIFHHYSPSSYTIQVDQLDNTVNGGTVHNPQFNCVSDIVSEQGGTGARCLVINYGGSYNTYIVSSNTSDSNIIPSDFNEHHNTFLNQGNLSLGSLAVSGDSSLGPITANSVDLLDVQTKKRIYLSGLTENTVYKLAYVNFPDENSVVVDIRGQVRSPSALRTSGFHGKWLVRRHGTTLYVRKLFSLGENYPSYSSLVEPTIDGTTITFAVYVGNNGTGTTNNGVSAEITVTGLNANYLIVYDTPEITSGAILPDECNTSRYNTPNGVFWEPGSGSPEGVVTAPIGSLYSRTDGGAGTTLYVKESGTDNTGWVAK